MRRRLLKFKYGGDDLVTVKYDVQRKNGTDVVTLECGERPSVALLNQLERMAKHLVAIAELPADWLEDLTVIGVTRTIGDKGNGLVITGLRELEHQDAPLCINSPHTNAFSEQCTLDLVELERLALRYVDGEERGQLALAFGEKVTPLHAAN